MGNNNELDRLMIEFQETWSVVNHKRTQWTNATYYTITTEFTKVVNQYSHLFLYMDIDNQSYQHLSSIILGFRDFSSGIFHKVSKKAILVKGGTLTFSQMTCGDIFIGMSYPYMDHGIRKQDDFLPLGRFTPNEITDTTVIHFVAVFIEKIIAWTNEDYNNASES